MVKPSLHIHRYLAANRKLYFAILAGILLVTIIFLKYLAKEGHTISPYLKHVSWTTSMFALGLLLVTYGRIELALISFIPVAIAYIWLLGISGLTALHFGRSELILSAAFIGAGGGYSFFILFRLLQQYKKGYPSYPGGPVPAIFFTITMLLIGLAYLVFGYINPYPVSVICISGVIATLLIVQILVPLFFHVLVTRRIQKGFLPWTAAGLFKSIFSLSYFAVGSLIVTGFGYVLVKWNPFAKSRARHLYHRMLSFYTWSVLYIMGNVKKKIINPQNEDFSKPCVMIANHQSFLDILVMTLLYPKVVLLTNNWVWNSPIFGRLVRIAGYYPTARGIENSIQYLETQVRAGYSIAVFPEGTRSPDEHIKRFHKGAFFIAEKLKLDILPIVIHGTGYTMSKGDFLLKDGYITVKYLPRVKPDDLYFGVDYAGKAKFLGGYFRQQYTILKEEMEQPRFFKEKLIYNYIYKGPVLEWYLRIKVRLEKNYELFHQLLPRKGLILDIGCGYGFMSYMLQFAAPERDVIGYDYDEDKIAVASHSFSRNANISFIKADVNEIEINPADAIILSDVLHYLKPDQQERLLRKCMEALRPDGILLIRDGDRDLKKRHQRTRASEFFSTRFFSFNKTSDNRLHFLSGNTIRNLALGHKMECRLQDPSVYTSNLLFIITYPVRAYEKV